MQNSNIQELQLRLGYTFKDISLLRRALTHKSFGKPHYERLEFVGDGILDYIIALILYQNYPDLSEGQLSKIRAALVNQDTLCELALSLKLGDYLFLGDGEEKSGGRNRPSILADTLEAIFAAVSFDSNIADSKQVIEHLYQDKLTSYDDLIIKDSKSILQEYLQSNRMNLPSYTVVELTGPDHDSVFKVECSILELDIHATASGKTKKEASQAVALQILDIIEKRKQNS
jgi:ribonuclease-3